MNAKLKLYNRDELFVIDLNSALFFKAEDHYTSVHYSKEAKQLLPFGLSHIEKAIAQLPGCQEAFLRAGRSHLLNSHKIVHANVTKEIVTLLSRNDVFVTIHIPRTAVKDIAKTWKCDDKPAETDGGGEFFSEFHKKASPKTHHRIHT